MVESVVHQESSRIVSMTKWGILYYFYEEPHFSLPQPGSYG